MLSDHERRVLDEIEVSLARGVAHRRARRASLLRTARLLVALASLGVMVWLDGAGLVARPAGTVLVASAGLIAGAFLLDASRQHWIEVRRRWHCR